MSINGGDYFPCWGGVSSVGNKNWICGRKDVLGFLGMGNSVKFNFKFNQVFDNRGNVHDIYWKNDEGFIIAGGLVALPQKMFPMVAPISCKNVGNGRLEVVYDQMLQGVLGDKSDTFLHRMVRKQTVKPYSTSLDISQ